MNALILKPRVRREIQSKVDRILRELDNPEPPLRLELVRELLELDRSYFTSESDGLMQMTFSRMKRAGKQIFKRPTLLGEAVKKFDLRAVYFPDEKRILIDDNIPKPKHRWLEAHEIGHDLLPWHHDMMLGDDDVTPTPNVHEKIEAEANYAAGILLFLSDRFIEECRSVDPTIKSAQELKKRYGNTFTTTLWRMIEHVGEDRPMIGLIGQHPRDFGNDTANFRHIIPSPAFDHQFDVPSVDRLSDQIETYCWGRRGPIGDGEVVVSAWDGSRHLFEFETFYNSYDALTLGRYSREVPLVISPGFRGAISVE